MSYDPKFIDGQWYRCRVEPDGSWDVSQGENKTVYYGCALLVTGGEMSGHVLPWQVFVTPKTKDQALARFRVLDFDASTQDLSLLSGRDSVIAGKELWAKCEIRPKNNGKGNYPPRAADIASISDRIPGGPAHKAALILGNTGTKAPDPDAYNDNY